MSQKTNPVVGIFCADLHLSENPPVARSAEKNWWDAMSRPLAEIAELSEKHCAPIFVAGDIFDRWDSKPAIINYALENLPHVAAIPGNHDTPFHNPALLGQSAYWSLVAAKKIRSLPESREYNSDFRLHAFPFGTPITQAKTWIGPQVAIIHAYCHVGGSTSFAGADDKSHIRKFDLRGYDAAFFGDNHIYWESGSGKLRVFNCGGFYRRRADEIAHEPGCGLLRADGQIERHKFDCSRDKFIDDADKLAAAEAATGLDLTGFAEELRGLAAAGLDFREILRRRCGDSCINGAVKKIILSAAGL